MVHIYKNAGGGWGVPNDPRIPALIPFLDFEQAFSRGGAASISYVIEPILGEPWSFSLATQQITLQRNSP
jgi:hypothetical protein